MNRTQPPRAQRAAPGQAYGSRRNRPGLGRAGNMHGLLARQGRAGLVIAAAMLVFTASASASVRREAPNHKINHSTSTNWAGYDVMGGRYTSVSATWTQPAVNCSVTPTGWSSFWVGLDGDTSGTVEQTGTEADCSNGHAVYSGWYEMYPKFPKTYGTPVGAGDRM